MFNIGRQKAFSHAGEHAAMSHSKIARGASHNLKSHSTKFGRYPFSRLANTTQAVNVQRKAPQYAIIAVQHQEATAATAFYTQGPQIQIRSPKLRHGGGGGGGGLLSRVKCRCIAVTTS